jgi:prepilin-type N-terminal cleavage/methylation domain-containing protein
MKQYSLSHPKGMTLIEVLIAMSITVIIMQGFTTMFLRAWQSNKFTLEMGLASSAAQRAVNKIGVELRGVQQAAHGTYPIISATASELIVYTDIEDDGVVERVRYYIDTTNKQLKVGIRDPDTTVQPPTYAAGDGLTRILAYNVVNTSSAQPLFAYYADNYPTVTSPIASPVDVSKIQLIRVQVFVNIDPNQAPNNIILQSFVDLRNLHGL